MMYTDDLIIFMEGGADPNLLKSAWNVVRQFGHFSGLKVNLAKTSMIVQNEGGQEWLTCFPSLGMDVKQYIGDQTGHRLGARR